MVKVRQLSPKLARRAEEELKENEARLKAGIKSLRKWLLLLPHIKEPLDDQWLAAFLRGNKFALERAKEKIETFYTMRTLIPEFFQNRDPTISPLRDFIQKGCFLPLENKTNPAGPSLSFFRANYNPSEFSINDVLKYSFLLLDLRIYEEDNMSVSGLIEICDLKDVTLKHMTSFTPTIAKKSSKALSEAYPVRVKGIHFLNPPTGFETTYTILKMFLPRKIKNRLHIHQKFETLYPYVPKMNLPEEYGGDAGTLDELTEKWISKVESRKDFLIDIEKYCTDENLRPNGPVTADSEYSICSVM